jgi:predicted nucleic acid-binding protein
VILVDTSVWADFFRGVEPSASRLDRLLEANEVALAGPVLTEVLRGVRTPRDRAVVAAAFEGCHWLEQPAALWREAGELGAAVGRKGFTVKTLDLLVAAHALAHDVELLTLDADFQILRRAGLALRLA